MSICLTISTVSKELKRARLAQHKVHEGISSFCFVSLKHDPPPLRRHNDARWKALKGLACLSPVPTGNPSILRRPLAKEQINSVCALERERPNPIIPFPGDTNQIVNSTSLKFTCVRNSFQKGHIDVLTPNREECVVLYKRCKITQSVVFHFLRAWLWEEDRAGSQGCGD